MIFGSVPMLAPWRFAFRAPRLGQRLPQQRPGRLLLHQQQIPHDPTLREPLLFGMEGDRRSIGIPCRLQDDRRSVSGTQDDGVGIARVDALPRGCRAHTAQDSLDAAQRWSRPMVVAAHHRPLRATVEPVAQRDIPRLKDFYVPCFT
jgi:hypothetical protein